MLAAILGFDRLDVLEIGVPEAHWISRHNSFITSPSFETRTPLGLLDLGVPGFLAREVRGPFGLLHPS
eukprot:5750012-Pyramimonas_sp.AAC.2